MAVVGKLEFGEKRCYSFEDFQALDQRVKVLEIALSDLQEIIGFTKESWVKEEKK